LTCRPRTFGRRYVSQVWRANSDANPPSLSGARAGAAVSRIFGAAGAVAGGTLGAVAGAVLGALAAGSAGATVGARAGKLLDKNLLDNYLLDNYLPRINDLLTDSVTR